MISLVVPARNEEENILAIVDRLDKLPFEKEIIIVDDNSTDSTGKICDSLQARIKTIHRKGNPGMGNALKDGTKIATGEIVVWIMADLSDDLSSVPKFIDKIQNGADIVFGSRYMKGGSSGDLDTVKALLSRTFTALTRGLFGIPVHDITNSFRAFRKEVLDKINPESGDFSIAPEMALKAHMMGFHLEEVPTTYATRKKGKPKMKVFKTSIKYFVLMFSLFPSYLKKRLF